jgi:hypothetical protein
MTEEFRMSDGGTESDAGSDLPDVPEFRDAFHADKSRGGGLAGSHLHKQVRAAGVDNCFGFPLQI